MSVDLLYPNEAAKAKKLTNTAFYEDLGFTHALFFGTLRLFGSLSEGNKILDYITTDVETIKYRLNVFDDLTSNNNFRTAIEKIMPRLLELIDLKNQRISEGDTSAHLYSICEMDLYFDAMSSLNDCLQANKDQITAVAIKNLTEFVFTTVNSEDYEAMKVNMAEAISEVKSVKSVTLGINLDAQLRPKEAGILSVNSQVFKEGNVMDKVLRLDFKNDGYYCTTPLDGISKGMSPEEADNFFMSLDASLDAVFKTSIKKWAPIVHDYMALNTEFLSTIVDQLAFYITGIAMYDKLKVYRLKVCKPEIHKMEEKECHLTGLYNPLFVLKESIRETATNSIVCDKFGSLYILTGSSRSGKSVFTSSVGVAQIMFQLGMYVPAESASLSPVDNVFTHCPVTIALEKSKAKAEAECEKLSNITKAITENSMLIVDDALQCTGTVEATYILTQVLLTASKAGVRGVVSTSLSDLADEADNFNNKVKDGSKIDTLVTKTENDRPVYVVERQRPDGADYAKTLSDKYGLTAKI